MAITTLDGYIGASKQLVTQKKTASIVALAKQIEQLKRCEFLKESEVRELCNIAKEILIEESNIQYLYSPITVSNLLTNFRSLDLR